MVESEAVWKVPDWFFTSTAPITPACSNTTSPAKLADQASVRGDRPAKNPEIRAEMLRLAADPAYTNKVLADGAEKARAIARPNMDAIKDILGLVR